MYLAPLPYCSGRYVVTVAPGHGPRATAISVGARPTFVYRAALNGFAARLTPRQLGRLRRNPDVTGIELDRAVGITSTQSMDAAGDPWGLDRIDQASLPLSQTYGYVKNGTGVRAYVIDTGIQADHSEFKLRIGSRATNVFDALGGSGADCHGHGTHVAGTIGGKTYGVAKRVQLRGVRVLDCNANGTLSQVIAGIEWVTVHHVKPAIANMSIGTKNGGSTMVDTAVKNLIASGVFVAVSAGNEAKDACSLDPGQGVSPARVKEAYTVAAADKSDKRAGFSNHGACVDAYAPGVGIKSALLGGGATFKDGTSMATPHVAGVAALLADPQFPPNAIKAWLDVMATKNVISGNIGATPNHLLFKPPAVAPPSSVLIRTHQAPKHSSVKRVVGVNTSSCHAAAHLDRWSGGRAVGDR